MNARYIGDAMYPGYGCEGYLERFSDLQGGSYWIFFPDDEPDRDAPEGSGYYASVDEYEYIEKGA